MSLKNNEIIGYVMCPLFLKVEDNFILDNVNYILSIENTTLSRVISKRYLQYDTNVERMIKLQLMDDFTHLYGKIYTNHEFKK